MAHQQCPFCAARFRSKPTYESHLRIHRQIESSALPPPSPAPAPDPAPAPAPEPELPPGGPPIPEEGLPEGWSIEQWIHYGQRWLDQQNRE